LITDIDINNLLLPKAYIMITLIIAVVASVLVPFILSKSTTRKRV